MFSSSTTCILPHVYYHSVTDHEISELLVLSPKASTQPIFIRISENTVSRVLPNLAGIEFVNTH